MRFATLAICGAPLHRLSARGDPHQYADAIALLVLGTAALFTFVLIDALNLAWSAFGWLVGSVSLIVSVKPRLSRWLRDIATREQADIVAALQLPGIESSQLLVICARNDEVRRWLRTWDAAAQAAFVIACGLLWSVAGAAGWNFPVVADGVARSVFHAGFNDVDVFGFDGWTLIVAAITLCAIWAVALLCGGIVRWPA